MVGKRIVIIEMVEGVLLVMRDAEEGGKGVRDEEVRDIVVIQGSLSSSNSYPNSLLTFGHPVSKSSQSVSIISNEPFIFLSSRVN